MHIVFLTHPTFLGSQSMPRFAKMLVDGMTQAGHKVEVWAPQPKVYDLPLPSSLKKWAGYIDQYIIFPAWMKKTIKNYDADTLFVFTDHALGPWVPLAANRPHVIHCHDFLAQRSAQGEIAENPTSYTGKKYQSYIKQGYKAGKNFISVSRKTQEDLHRFLGFVPAVSEVVYNGLNTFFKPANISEARAVIGNEIGVTLTNGYLLHVGGNQWYKNRIGVIEIYDAWRKNSNNNLPLVMIGAPANGKLKECYNASPYSEDIYLLTGKDDSFVKQAYIGASVFLFPSLAEGFGWPIAEAMASGIPTITTSEGPMNEVGGDAAFYISRRPLTNSGAWAEDASSILSDVISLNEAGRENAIDAGLEHVKQFDMKIAIRQIEGIYQDVLGRG
ncbi:glycosyltransferase [Mucilaginibacter jinjuensis]|uniref:Glycosyltransferase n=1 Tax=Mucilaginibacter jinjuensis TaxID=1176721 RepID=A0ABY7TF85_9SPHI|nr:glycosyltransferase [Mucilaginibacter jinjuensis]WCT13837.1 glycosyltransferase [Mucilaginibacter jinjuensis]